MPAIPPPLPVRPYQPTAPMNPAPPLTQLTQTSEAAPSAASSQASTQTPALSGSAERTTTTATHSAAKDAAADDKQQAWAVAGPVVGVRAVRAREVSVITVEIPDDFHVESTRLLFAQDALIQAIEMPQSANYGVWNFTQHGQAMDLALQSTQTSSALSDEDRLVFLGHVSTVRPIPSRGMTAIHIEVPEQFHILATRIFYGRDALIMASSLPAGTAYGPGPNASHTSRLSTAGAPAFKAANQGRPHEANATQGPRGSAKSGSKGSSDSAAVKWLALRCKEPDFWQMLGASSEAEAIDAVRSICGVRSRSEVIPGTQAHHLFEDNILRPWREFKTQQQQHH